MLTPYPLLSWYLHPLFIRHFFHDCIRLDENGAVRSGSEDPQYEDKYADKPKPTCCQRDWMVRVQQRAVVALPPPGVRIIGQPGLIGVPHIRHDDEYEPPQYRRSS